MNEAWPGDIIGLVGHPDFLIGDTLTEDTAIVYNEIALPAGMVLPSAYSLAGEI